MATVDQPLKETCEQCDREFPAQDAYFNEHTQEMLCFSCNEGQNEWHRLLDQEERTVE